MSNSIDLRPHFVGVRSLQELSVVLKGLRNGVLEYPIDKSLQLTVETHNSNKLIKLREYKEAALKERETCSTSTTKQSSLLFSESPSAEQNVKSLSCQPPTLVSSSSLSPSLSSSPSSSLLLPLTTLSLSHVSSLPPQDHGIFPDLYANNNIMKALLRSTNPINNITTRNTIASLSSSSSPSPSSASLLLLVRERQRQQQQQQEESELPSVVVNVCQVREGNREGKNHNEHLYFTHRLQESELNNTLELEEKQGKEKKKKEESIEMINVEPRHEYLEVTNIAHNNNNNNNNNNINENNSSSVNAKHYKQEHQASLDEQQTISLEPLQLIRESYETKIQLRDCAINEDIARTTVINSKSKSNMSDCRNNVEKSSTSNTRRSTMLCVWDIDDTLVGSGSAGIRQHPVFKYEELKRVFKSVSGPDTRHLLLSQGSIDDVLAEDGSSKLGYLREFFDTPQCTSRNEQSYNKSNSHKNGNGFRSKSNKVRVLCHNNHNTTTVTDTRASAKNLTPIEEQERQPFLIPNEQEQHRKAINEQNNCNVSNKPVISHQREQRHEEEEEWQRHNRSVIDATVERCSSKRETSNTALTCNNVDLPQKRQHWRNIFTSLFTCKTISERRSAPAEQRHGNNETSMPTSTSTSTTKTTITTSSLSLSSPPPSASLQASLSNSAPYEFYSSQSESSPRMSSSAPALARISPHTYLIQLHAIRHNAFHEFESRCLYNCVHHAPYVSTTTTSSSSPSSSSFPTGTTFATKTEQKFARPTTGVDNKTRKANPHYLLPPLVAEKYTCTTETSIANSDTINGNKNFTDKSINSNNNNNNNNSTVINDGYSRWLILRPEIWGITLSSLSTPIPPSQHTAFVDGRRFRKMDVVWSLAKSGNWDVVFFVDNSLCEVGVARPGSKLMDLLQYRHGNHMRNFYKAEYMLLAASAKLRQMEQRLHRDVTRPTRGFARSHASHFHRARMGSFASAKVTPSDFVTPALHTTRQEELHEELPHKNKLLLQSAVCKSETANHTTKGNTSNSSATPAHNNIEHEPFITETSSEMKDVHTRDTCSLIEKMKSVALKSSVNNKSNSNNDDDDNNDNNNNSNNNIIINDTTNIQNVTHNVSAKDKIVSSVSSTRQRDNPLTIGKEESWEEESKEATIATMKSSPLQPQTIDASQLVEVASLRSNSYTFEVMEYNTRNNSEMRDQASCDNVNCQCTENCDNGINSDSLEKEEEEEEEEYEEQQEECAQELCMQKEHLEVNNNNNNNNTCYKKYTACDLAEEDDDESKNENDEFCDESYNAASRHVDLVVVNFHMPSSSYRTILHGCRTTTTVVTSVTSQRHGSKKGSKEVINPATFSRYVGQPVFTSNVGCTDEQYSAVMKMFWAQLNALYQLLEEDLRVNGFVDLGKREKWRPRTSTVHFASPESIPELPYLGQYYRAVCDEIEQRLILPLLSHGDEWENNMYEICAVAFELYEKLIYGVIFTDPVLTRHVALDLFEIYNSESHIPRSLLKQLREDMRKLLALVVNDKK